MMRSIRPWWWVPSKTTLVKDFWTCSHLFDTISSRFRLLTFASYILRVLALFISWLIFRKMKNMIEESGLWIHSQAPELMVTAPSSYVYRYRWKHTRGAYLIDRACHSVCSLFISFEHASLLHMCCYLDVIRWRMYWRRIYMSLLEGLRDVCLGYILVELLPWDSWEKNGLGMWVWDLFISFGRWYVSYTSDLEKMYAGMWYTRTNYSGTYLKHRLSNRAVYNKWLCFTYIGMSLIWRFIYLAYCGAKHGIHRQNLRPSPSQTGWLLLRPPHRHEYGHGPGHQRCKASLKLRYQFAYCIDDPYLAIVKMFERRFQTIGLWPLNVPQTPLSLVVSGFVSIQKQVDGSCTMGLDASGFVCPC